MAYQGIGQAQRDKAQRVATAIILLWSIPILCIGAIVSYQFTTENSFSQFGIGVVFSFWIAVLPLWVGDALVSRPKKHRSY